MSQLPDPLDTLTPQAKVIFDKIVARRGRLRGPYAPLMHHPALAERIADLGEYLRFDSTLPGDIREMAILITARHVSQPYEWFAHAPIGRQAGLPEDVIERIRARGDLNALPPRYAKAARLVQHALAFESVPADLQQTVQAELSLAGVLELVALTGHYRLIASVLFAFDVPLPDGAPAPF